MRKVTYLVLFSLIVLSCSTHPPTFNLKLNSHLKDGGKLSVTVDVTVSDTKSLKEIERKAESLNRAFSIVLREYHSDQLKGKGEMTVKRILVKIFSLKIKSKVDQFKIKKYSVRSLKN